MFHHESITSTEQVHNVQDNQGMLPSFTFELERKEAALHVLCEQLITGTEIHTKDLIYCCFFFFKCANADIIHQVKTTKSKAFKVCNKMPSYCGVKTQEAADDSPSSMQQGKPRVSAGYAIASVNCLDVAFIIKKSKKKYK